MEKIIFENLPSMATKLNAQNLNQIQDNAENAINENTDKINNLFSDYKKLGEVLNSDTIITLADDKLSNYKFLVVSSGYGVNKCMTTIPVSLFSNMGANFLQAMQYVKIYGGQAYTSIQYISDTQFKINGAVGVDTGTIVYGIK